MGLKLGKQTPLQRAAEQLQHWDRIFSKAEYLSEEWRLADRQLAEWMAKWRDLNALAQRN